MMVLLKPDIGYALDCLIAICRIWRTEEFLVAQDSRVRCDHHMILEN